MGFVHPCVMLDAVLSTFHQYWTIVELLELRRAQTAPGVRRCYINKWRLVCVDFRYATLIEQPGAVLT
jgi:hypothetical protein